MDASDSAPTPCGFARPSGGPTMPRFRSLLFAALTLALLPAIAAAQERATITGTVTADNTGQPLSGALVSVVQTSLRATADENGRFQIVNVPVGAQTLRVTRLGYRPASRVVQVVAGGVTVNLGMPSDPLRLEEMVVTGYGEERRRNLTGAISSLKMDEVAKDIPVVSLQGAMQGRVAGVMVVQNAGNPGNAMTVRVRGSSSISGGNDPLYVVDGVPMTQGNQQALNIVFGGQGIDAVSDLNSSEIERIEVLKDASAAAIYGSRASNGVVLITTKRGTSTRPEITFGSYYGTQKDWRRLDMLNAQEYMEIYNEGSDARFGPATASGYDQWYCYASSTMSCETEVIPGTDTDWLSLVLQPATIGNVESSVRGGTERVRYYVAGSSLQQEGIIKSMGYRRLNGRVNLDYMPREKLALGTNVSLGRSITDRHSSDNTIYSAWANAMANPPIEPVYNSDGTYYETLYANPVAMNEETESEERGIRILGNVFGQYEVFSGIIGRVSAGLDQLTMNGRRYDSPTYGPWAPSGGRGQVGNNYVTKNSFEGTVSFNRALADVHAVSGVVGSSYETNKENWNYVQGTNFPTESFKYLTSAASISTGTSTRTDWNLVSMFGRLTYTFNDRVTGTFNVRRDGSSRFGTDNRFGIFPSASVNWRIGDESFMQNQTIVGNLALRASYGLTGNQQSLGNFASRGLFSGGANYLDVPGIFPSQLSNPDLRWEKTTQRNIGTDFSVLDERLSFTIDLYHKRTDDLLVARPVPRTTGFSTIWSNVGSMENKGYEVSTTVALFRPRAARGFDWQAIVNLSQNKNQVLELYNDQPFSSGFGGRVEAGKPLGFFYGHVTDGIFQSAAEVAAHATQTVHSNPLRATSAGDIRFKDINGRGPDGQLTGMPDGVINDDDRTMIGNPWPELEGGITNTMSWRGFDASAFLQFSLGNDIMNAQQIYMAQYGSGGDNHTTAALERWTPTNTSATEPRAIWGDPNRNTRYSDRFVEDGSYWRVKNVVLGYTLPQSVLPTAMRARTARVYVQAQNLMTFTDYTGFDPEVNSNGNSSTARGQDFYALPQPRTITFGLNLAY
jgi:TonB-linked SusC/RagA family outer membrane protein